jgi:spore germination cell wall hydrolase CwlJ-like protein
VRHKQYPATICGVVYEGSGRSTGCQFSFTCDGSLSARREKYAWEAAEKIAHEALTGYVYAPVGHATHYHTKQVNPYWSGALHTLTVVREHIFYRWRGEAGEPSPFLRRT